jgi:putative membrane protein
VGSEELRDGAVVLSGSLKDGASSLADEVPSNSNSFASFVATPLSMNEEVFGSLEYFGLGFAPLFMVLALWVGTLMIFFLFDPYPENSEKYNRFQIILGRLPLFLLFGLLEALAIIAAVSIADVPMTNWFAFLFFFLLATVVFVLIMQMFNLLFGLPGKVLIILLVIIQLAAASGTLPVLLSNEIVQALSPWLPFTYAIDGIRELMSGGNMPVVFSNAVHLAGFGLIALGLELVLYPLGVRITRIAQRYNPGSPTYIKPTAIQVKTRS